MINNNYCEICGRPAEAKHHWIGGKGYRAISEKDKIYGYLCNNCHNMSDKAVDRIHGNNIAEKLGKRLGQEIWEKRWILDHITEYEDNLDKLELDAKLAFLERYGRRF